MTTCKTCIHEEACVAWIRHGEILYDDFEYNVEHCPYYEKAKHGRWIHDDEYDICSNCNNPIIMNRLRPDRWCKNCGAKMDGGTV